MPWIVKDLVDKQIAQNAKLRFLYPLMCSLFCCFFTGCALLATDKDIRSRAYISDDDPMWRITHGSILGMFETDILTSKRMKIEVDFSRYGYNFTPSRGEFFDIRTEFTEVTDEVVFFPSRVTLKLSNGDVLQPKSLDCERYKLNHTLRDLRRMAPLEERTSITPDGCTYLIFDHPAPPLEEEAVLYFNDSISSNGHDLDVPPVYFRKTVDYIYRWGCIM